MSSSSHFVRTIAMAHNNFDTRPKEENDYGTLCSTSAGVAAWNQFAARSYGRDPLGLVSERDAPLLLDRMRLRETEREEYAWRVAEDERQRQEAIQEDVARWQIEHDKRNREREAEEKVRLEENRRRLLEYRLERERRN